MAKCKRCGHQDCECDLNREQQKYDRDALRSEKLHIVVLDPTLDPKDNCIRSVDGPGQFEHYYFQHDPFQPRNRIRQLSCKVSMAEAIYKFTHILLD